MYLYLHLNGSILIPVDLSKFARWLANSVNPDQMPYYVGYDLDPHYLLRPVNPSTYGE